MEFFNSEGLIFNKKDFCCFCLRYVYMLRIGGVGFVKILLIFLGLFFFDKCVCFLKLKLKYKCICGNEYFDLDRKY